MCVLQSDDEHGEEDEYEEEYEDGHGMKIRMNMLIGGKMAAFGWRTEPKCR